VGPYRGLGGLAAGVGARFVIRRVDGRRCGFVVDGLRGMLLYVCGLAWRVERGVGLRWKGEVRRHGEREEGRHVVVVS
jgi:hypothetical protein